MVTGILNHVLGFHFPLRGVRKKIQSGGVVFIYLINTMLPSSSVCPGTPVEPCSPVSHSPPQLGVIPKRAEDEPRPITSPICILQGGGCSATSAPAGTAYNQPWVRCQPSWTWKDMTSYCFNEDLCNTVRGPDVPERDANTAQTNSLKFWLDFVAVFFPIFPLLQIKGHCKKHQDSIK